MTSRLALTYTTPWAPVRFTNGPSESVRSLLAHRALLAHGGCQLDELRERIEPVATVSVELGLQRRDASVPVQPEPLRDHGGRADEIGPSAELDRYPVGRFLPPASKP